MACIEVVSRNVSSSRMPSRLKIQLEPLGPSELLRVNRDLSGLDTPSPTGRTLEPALVVYSHGTPRNVACLPRPRYCLARPASRARSGDEARTSPTSEGRVDQLLWEPVSIFGVFTDRHVYHTDSASYALLVR